jgi:hypothetical protein
MSLSELMQATVTLKESKFWTSSRFSSFRDPWPRGRIFEVEGEGVGVQKR